MLKDNTLEEMVNAFDRNYDFLYKEEERNDVSVHTLVNTLAEEYCSEEVRKQNILQR